MSTLRSVVLSVTFTPDDHYRAIITGHTIPEKKAYQVSLRDIGALNEYGDSFEAKRRRLEEIIFERASKLKRYPNADYDHDPIAPIQQMFRDGFYETNWTSHFYAGMGHSGEFLGVMKGEIEGDKMTILGKVDIDLSKNSNKKER